MLQNLLVDSCINFGLDKTQWTNTSRRHSTPNHPWLWKLHTDFKQAWILCRSTLPPDSRPWFPNDMQHLLLSEKRTLNHWANSPVLFLYSPVKMLLTICLFQKWNFTDSSFSPLLVKLSQVFESALLKYSQACGHPCCLCTFSYPFPSFQSTLHLIWFDTALLEQPPLSAMTHLWLTLFVAGVNDRLLDHCQVSVFPIIVVSKTGDAHNLYSRDGHLIKLKYKYSNILIYWISDFHKL